MTPASPDPGAGGRLRVRLDLSYDGTSFHGWAAQPGLRTVQDDLETALGRVLRLRPAPRLTVAGRTDAGVHARGQVCHADLPQSAVDAAVGRSDATFENALVRRLAGVLPSDIRVYAAQLVSTAFDARFSAVQRRYAYRVADGPIRPDPLRRAQVYWHRRPLDLEAMNTAARALVGEHDFAAYCRPRPGATTVRHVRALHWDRESDGVARASVVADAFCHNQVRAMVGALIAVGEGRAAPSWPGTVLESRVRDSAVGVAPAHGLVLEEVCYPPPEQWETRATSARSRRSLPST
ncbi:MAG TPA: tRNA pseudouridine(38-40) synthase TruA [Jiangellaceae bacterium]|nr:tRNA pseudouridine(38-40) synthase TruA [Jiangellaceae bacterium]